MIKRQNDILWISSDNGIFEFNGFDLTHYNEQSDSTFSGEIIMSDFYELKNGNILFSTDKALLQYSTSSEQFEAVVEDEINEFNNEFYLFLVEDDSLAWARIGDSISVVNIQSRTLKNLAPTNSVRFDVYSAYCTKSIIGCPWIQEPGLEITRFYANDSIHTDKLVINHKGNDGLVQPEFSDVFIANDSIVWACSTEGLFKINYTEKKSYKCFTLPDVNNTELTFGTWESDSTLILSSKKHGVWKFNTQQESFVDQISTKNGLHSNDVREIYIDDDNTTWISALNSSVISYLKTKNIEFESILLDNDPNSNTGIDFLFDLNDTVLFFSSEGIYKEIQDEPILYSPYKSSRGETLKINRPFHISSYTDSLFWLSHLNKVYLSNNSLEFVPFLTLDTTRIISFHQIGPDDALLLTSEGLKKLKISTKQVSQIHSDRFKSGLLEITKILSFENDFFIVYNDRTLIPIDPMSNSILSDRRHTFKSSVFSVSVYDTILYASTLAGLEVIDLRRSSANPELYKPEFITSGAFYKSIIQDSSIWISTSKGLLKTSLVFSDWNFYSQLDGMTSDVFMPNAGLAAKNGSVYFTVQDGAVKFDPKMINNESKPPALKLAEFLVNDKAVPIDKSFTDSSYHFKYFENSLRLRPLSLSYFHQDKNRVFYKLDSEDNWNEIANNEDFNLRLNPGDYQLSFLGINANGIKSKEEVLQIQIALPFWKSSEFILACLGLSGLILYVLIRNIYARRLKRMRDKFALEKSMNERIESERNRIASEMHDELGGGLTSIKLLAQRMNHSESLQTIEPSLQKVEKYAIELVENMRSIIWSMDSKNNSLGDTLAYIRYYIDDTLENGQIHTDFISEIEDPDYSLSSTLRRNLFLVIKEIINNILKHSEADKVIVTISQNDILSISISDNGIGIKSEFTGNHGNGLRNITNRIKDIGGNIEMNSNNGTTIVITVNLI